MIRLVSPHLTRACTRAWFTRMNKVHLPTGTFIGAHRTGSFRTTRRSLCNHLIIYRVSYEINYNIFITVYDYPITLNWKKKDTCISIWDICIVSSEFLTEAILFLYYVTINMHYRKMRINIGESNVRFLERECKAVLRPSTIKGVSYYA